MPTHEERGKGVMAKLAECGLSPETQRRLGAFAVVWGIFESNLELALWALRGEDVTGKRPSTERMRISEQMAALGECSERFGVEAGEVLRSARQAAADLLEYRHAIAHGSLVPFSDAAAAFIRNPKWDGAKRSRRTNTAHVDENLLGIAIDVGWTLFRVVLTARLACENEMRIGELENLKPEVNRATRGAGELRYLTELMNDEKH